MENQILNTEQIKAWKDEHKHIYKTIIDEQAIIWRKLKRAEYKDIMLATMKNDDGEDTPRERTERLYKRQELVTAAVVLYPDNIEELLENSAGAASGLCGEVMERSGFEDLSSEEM